MTDLGVAAAGRDTRPWTAAAVEVVAREGFIVIFAVWAAYLAIATDTFLTQDNILLLLRQAAIFSIVGIGITLVTILGELDISFGATIALAGCVSAAWVIGGTHPVVGIAIAVAIGCAVGLVNGVLVNYVRIPSVVATLGVLGAVEGLAQMYTGGSSIFGDPLRRLDFLARDELVGIPIPVLIAFGLYAVAWLVTTRTRFGAHLYATGDNREAAYRAGIAVQRIRLVVFVVAGALAGFAGLMQVVRIGRAQSSLGMDALFPVLTAVILGGTSLHGGRGRIVNTLIASVFLASITNGLILLGVPSEVQRLVQGAVLILAVSLDRLRDEAAVDGVVAPPPLFAAHGLWKHYGGVAAVRDVSIAFPAGTVTAIVGDNGAGKSTLVKMLVGATHPDRGHLALDGEPVRFATPAAAQAAGIATVYQDLALADHRNVAENLFLGRELVREWGPVRWLARAEMRRSAVAALADLKIQIPDVRREARTLSGGQRQGVAIARAVHEGSRVLVMDEPMAALGLQEQGRVSELIEHLATRGLTLLIVSHNLDHVFRLATRIAVMRLGHLVAVRETAATDRREILHLVSGIEP